MNRRTIAVICLMAAAASLVPSTVQALPREEDERGENIYVYPPMLDKVDAIDLKMVLERALKNNENLALLALKATALQAKEDDLNAQVYQSYEGNPGGSRLPETPEELQEAMAQQGIAIDPETELWIGPMTTMTNKSINQAVQGIGEFAFGLNEIIAQQRHQMRSTAHQLEADRYNSYHEYNEAKEAIRLQQIAQYVNLLGMKKQIAVMDESEQTAMTELNRATLLRDQGLASHDDVVAASRALAERMDRTKQLKENFRLALIQLSFDIGIAYNPDLVIRDIEGIVFKPVKRVDTAKLLENAYQIKIASNNLDEAKWQRDLTVTSSVYSERYLSANASIAAVQNQKTQLELTKKIEATYSEADQALLAYKEELRNVQDIREDHRKMEIRYEAGAVSKHEMNAFGLKLKQAEAAQDIAAWKFYAAQEKAEAMKRGFIS